MRKIIIIMSFSFVFGQLDQIWNKTLGGNGSQGAYGITHDQNGDLVVVGYTSAMSTYGNDAWIIKTSAVGDSIWSHGFGNFGNWNGDANFDVIITNNNQYLITGYTTTQNLNGNMFFKKYTQDGDITLYNIFHGTGAGSVGYKIAKLSNNNYLIIGRKYSYGGPESLNGHDANIVEVDNFGDVQNDIQLGEEGFDSAYDFLQSEDNGFIIVGSKATMPQAGGHDREIWIYKINEFYEIEWEILLGNGIIYDVDEAKAITKDNQGNYYVCSNGQYGESQNIRLTKVNDMGEILWDNYIEKEFDQICNDIFVNSFNEILIVGSTETGSSGLDGYILKINQYGNEIWEQTIGGSNDDIMREIIEEQPGIYIIAGESSSYNINGIDLWLSNYEDLEIEIGCNDPQACNYDPDETEEGGYCEYPPEGFNCDEDCIIEIDCLGECGGSNICDCTDPLALNYNPNATSNDGSCYYCEGENPQGCIYTGCPADEECIMIDCYPSFCECNEEYNNWSCLQDCDGGVCVEIVESPIGDINYDGTVNITDIIYMVNLILDDLEPSADELWAADMNDDGMINIVDVINIVAEILNSTPETVTDIDGNVYQTVQIGNQLWMAENLKATHYNNGDEIPTGLSDEVWESLTTGAYAIYNDFQLNQDTYGNLYNWYALDDIRGICPEGWHVPSDDEFNILEMYLGMSESEANNQGAIGTDEGGKMKEVGTEHWISPNTGATNESGFTGLPGGYRNYGSGHSSGMSTHAYFWSITDYDNSNAWYRGLPYDGANVYREHDYKRYGFSVRCVGD